ncbi:hypothetical protein ACKVEX_09575 [Rhodocyclaceae bacterium SMB388]
MGQPGSTGLLALGIRTAAAHIAIVQADIRMGPLFYATIPFLVMVLFLLVVIAAVPEIATWLPSLMTNS